jgi:hypothetical protein
MKKSRFWTTAVIFALLSFIILWVVLEGIFHSMPDARLRASGYQAAGILTFIGIAGVAVGVKIMKMKPGLAAGLIGFFFTPFVLGIATLILGP